MRDHLTTPLALILAAVLLLAISFIPPRDAGLAEQSPAATDLIGWAHSLPLEREEHRLALVLAVYASSWALDRVLADQASTSDGATALALPAPTSRRATRPTRPLMPFYSFASPRSQES